MSGQSAEKLAIVLLAFGVALIAIGMIYFTVAADHLPVLLGQIEHASEHRTKRGIAALVVGLVSLGGGWFAYAKVTRRRYVGA